MDLTRKNLFLIGVVVSAIIVAGWAYLNSPQIVFWLNPKNGVTIDSVSYPNEVYRSQSLPIIVSLSNCGPDAKNVRVDVIPKDGSVISNELCLSSLDSKADTTIYLPVTSLGNQAFSVEAFWVGPMGLCSLKQNSTDRPFRALAADFDISSTPKFASRAQDFDWMLTVENIGNTPADLSIQIAEKDPLIISSTDAQKIENIQVGETRSVNFHFIVPSSAALGDMTIGVNYLTSYPEIDGYADSKETSIQNYAVTIQESPIKTQIDNAGSLLTAILAAMGLSGGAVIVLGKRRRY